jgi:protein-disulfide isomerase
LEGSAVSVADLICLSKSLAMSQTRSARFRTVTVTMAAVLAATLTLAFAPGSNAADPPPATDQAVSQKAAGLLHDPRTQVLGNPNGDVTIVEFFDYACPYCKAAEPRLQALLKADGKVKLVIKEFPILTPQSLVATKVALAAVKQGKYAQFHQALMLYKGQLEEPVIFDTAKSVGIDLRRLRKDNLNLARSLRIFATPTFIVGNHIVTEPSATLDFPKVVAAARAG